MSTPTRVCVVSASLQNVFFTEITEAIAAALRENGLLVEESVDCFPHPEPGLVYMFVPHEYYPLVDELAHPTPEQLRRTLAIGTEQPGTQWFDLACDIAARAGAAVDINQLGAAEMRRRGLAAQYLPLGYIPEWDRWRREGGEREIDMAFLGGYTERRGRALAASASRLTGRRCAIYLTETAQPHRDGSPHFLSRQRKWGLMADTKVILNVHRGELPYMEWHRVLGAILNGCVVLSERSIGAEPLVAGEHYVSTRFEDIPSMLGALLDDPERLQTVRETAYDFVREQMPLREAVADLMEEIERLGRIDPGPNAGAMPKPLALPLPPPHGPPEWEAHAGNLGPDRLPVRMALKHLVVGVRALERRVEDLANGGPPAEERLEHLGVAVEQPRISVLLTVYNYADHVGDAIRSVALAEEESVEVIAVDDGSSDGSVAAIEAAAGRYPWLPITLLERGRNHGLPSARNLALAHARGEYVFVLDADNLVLRDGLTRLREALDEHGDVDFAYGLIECFDHHGPCDVFNWIDWSPERLRHGNYIDAMAMIRRSALEEIGGYPLDPALLGWEDFAVWVAMADAGRGGVRVPDFVARYRRAAHSMLSLTSIDVTAAWAALLRRYPSLASSTDFGRVVDPGSDSAQPKISIGR